MNDEQQCHKLIKNANHDCRVAQLDLTHLTEVREPGLPVLSDEKSKESSDDAAQQNAFGGKDTAFGRLVLEHGHKNMIVSLITQHFRDKEAKGAQTEQVDIIRGKGKTAFSK